MTQVTSHPAAPDAGERPKAPHGSVPAGRAITGGMVPRATIRSDARPTAVPSLAWSCSQQRTFDDCPRARFWASEIAPTGWRDDATEIARAARRLKTLTTLDMEAGRTLHERAAERARALREGESMPSVAAMRQRAATHMRYIWISSRDRYADWLRDPKRVPMLLDRHYGRGPTREQALAVRERLERGVITLGGLGLWGELAACAPSDILIVDSLTSYTLPNPDGGAPVLVWAAPDLVMRVEPDGLWEVVDYKGGRMRDGRAFRDAVAQVHTYTAYLRHGARVLGPGDGCRGRLILLGDGTEHEFTISSEDIDAAEARIREGARAMAALAARADEAATAALERAAAFGTEPREQEALVLHARRAVYPMTGDRSRCRRCPYLELCLPEQLQAAPSAGAEEVA